MLEEFVDDDVSAYSGKTRPAYERMLEAIRQRQVDAVLVWHMDRLHRRPIELEEFVTTCAAAGLKDVLTLHGDFDMGTGDGLMVARIMGAAAAYESDAKSRRSRRKMQELAERGRPHGGGVRPFGFTDDRTTVHPGEARIIRDLAGRLLAGESLVSLTQWLHDNDTHTVTGKQWRTPTVRALLLSPRIAGLREHQGQVIGKAVWEPIIPETQREQIVALLTDPARRTNRTARRYLLSGLVRCSRCGSKMVTGQDRTRRRYLCRSGADFGGCGSLTITAVPLDQFVADAVLYRLDSPELAAALAGNAAADADAASLREAIAADAARLIELSDLYADQQITAPEWMAARKRIDARLTLNRRKQTTRAGTPVLAGHVGNGTALRQQWESLNLSRQAAIVRAVIDHVAITPGTQGARTLDPGRVQVTWRL